MKRLANSWRQCRRETARDFEHFPNFRELLRALKGGFFLMKKPRGGEASVYNYSGNAADIKKEEPRPEPGFQTADKVSR